MCIVHMLNRILDITRGEEESNTANPARGIKERCNLPHDFLIYARSAGLNIRGLYNPLGDITREVSK